MITAAAGAGTTDSRRGCRPDLGENFAGENFEEFVVDAGHGFDEVVVEQVRVEMPGGAGQLDGRRVHDLARRGRARGRRRV